MKKLMTIAVILIVALFILTFTKDIIIKGSVENLTKMVTGLELKMRKMSIGIIRSVVDIRGLQLLNPKTYPDRVMLDMPEIYVEYDLPAIIGGKMHLKKMRIYLKEFVVIKNAEGKLNLDSLKIVQAQKAGKRPSKGEKGKTPEIQIDELLLKVDKVIYKDYSKGATPSVREFDVALDERYQNIRDPYLLASLIVVRSLTDTSVSRLANFDLGGLNATVSDSLGSAHNVVTQTTGTATKAVTQTTQQAQEVVKSTTETLKKIGLPFGSD